MRVKVIEVRNVLISGRTTSDEPVYTAEVEVEVFSSEDGPARRIILHPGESVEYLGGCVYVNRAAGVFDLEKAPIR